MGPVKVSTHGPEAVSRQVNGTMPVPSKVRAPVPVGLSRERLETTLARLEAYRLALVVAPAGSGKTTLLAQLAAVTGVPTAWYRAEIWDRDEPALVGHLRVALRSAIGGFDEPVESVDDLLRALDDWTGDRAALVIDDLHTLEGTPAEQAVERLVDYAPDSLTVLAGSRVQPGFNLSRLRVSGGLVEIGADELRFRPWEIERLFRHHYLQQVPPQELAVLARRTEGWAAGLQLFHLATRGKSPDERRRILAGVAAGSRLTREYLAQNVLGDLSEELRRFLVETSVLGRLSGPLCDQLLGSSNGRTILEELERRQIFTTALDDDGGYRYHEVLRSHLLTMLVEERGELAAREHHLRAGRLLEDAGAFPEALSAYSRGQDWASAERILGRTGEALVERPTTWLDALPPSLVRHDPWLLLASARYARDEGRWGVAIDAYQRAEKAFGSADAALVCRRERISLAGWLSPAPTPGGAWSDRLRSATIRDPGAARRLAEEGGDWSDRLVAGVALLLAGSPIAAREVLAQVIDDEAVPPAVAAGAALAEAIGALMVDDRTWNDRLEAAANAAERLNVRWLARSGRAVLAAARDPDGTQVAADIAACREDGDRWGEALIELSRAWFAAGGGDRKPADRAASIVRDLGAGTLEGWARSLAALAAAVGDDGDARDTAFAADAQARTVGTPGPRLLAFLALRQADLQGDDTYESIAADLRTETGLSLPPHRPHGVARPAAGAARTNGAPAGDGATERRAARDPDVAPARARRMPATARPGAAAPLRVTCFGGYTIRVGDEPVDLGLVKPRSRVLLRFLSLHAGTWVHREVITEALWPDGDRDSPARSLQVGLSTVRRLLEPDSERASAYLVRDADAYRLELPPGSWVDLSELERGVAQGHAARAAGDEHGARDWLRRSLEAYRGDLLPEDGPATWVVEPRERLRGLAARAGQWLAELSLGAGDPAEATRASLAGLAIDRYSDPLWRLLISAREAAGDHGAASRARQEYAVVLAGLGVADDDDDGDGAPGPPGRSRATRRDPSPAAAGRLALADRGAMAPGMSKARSRRLPRSIAASRRPPPPGAGFPSPSRAPSRARPRPRHRRPPPGQPNHPRPSPDQPRRPRRPQPHPYHHRRRAARESCPGPPRVVPGRVRPSRSRRARHSPRWCAARAPASPRRPGGRVGRCRHSRDRRRSRAPRATAPASRASARPD